MSLAGSPERLKLTQFKTGMKRPQLSAHFELGAHASLTLVRAGGGFGKSTAVAAYLDGLMVPTAWYPLEEADNDLIRFLTRLVEAVRAAYPDFAPGFLSSNRNLAQAASGRCILADLLGNAFAGLGGPMVIALDNYQCLHEQSDVAAFVSRLLEHLTGDVRFIIATRSQPRLPLSRLRARGELYEIGASELVFTAPEVQALISLECEGLATPEAIRLIHEKSEGWPAGVVMLAKAVRQKGLDLLEALASGFRLTGIGIYEYLADEVLRAEPQHVQSFLMRTSILKTLEVDLCEELLGSNDASLLLEYLEEKGLFTVGVASTTTTFRYHELFRTFLQFMLAREYASRDVVDLHVRAGQCYEARDEPDEAVRHYIAGRRLDLAARAVEAVAERYIEMGMLEIVDRWFECLAPQVSQFSPRLRGLQALVRARRRGQFLSAIEGFEVARRGFQAAGDRRGFIWSSTQVASLYYQTGKFEQGIAALDPLLAICAELTPDESAEVLRVLCNNYRGKGDLQAAVETGRKALESALSLPEDYRKCRVARALAQAHLYQGNLADALTIAEFGLQLGEVGGRTPNDFELASIWCLLGIIHAHRGDDAAALTSFGQIEAHMGQFAAEHWGCMNTWRGDVERDRGNFALALQYYDRSPSRSLAECSFLHVRQGNYVQGESLARQALVGGWHQGNLMQSAVAETAYGIAMSAVGSFSEAEAAFLRAQEMYRRLGRRQYEISVCMHLFVLNERSGRKAAALDSLRAALAVGRELHVWYFPFWDPNALRLAGDWSASLTEEENRCLDQLRQVLWLRDPPAAQGMESADSPVLPATAIGGAVKHDPILGRCPDARVRQRLCAALGVIFPAGGTVAVLRETYGLTWREIDVLVAYYLRPAVNGLPDGESRQLACVKELHITINTLKRHISAIRQKLDIAPTANPLHLIGWARAQGLIA